MKNNILNVMRKELSRFLGDKRLFFSTILLPGLMIYVMYTFMGSAISTMYAPSEDPVTLYAVAAPDVLSTALQAQFQLNDIAAEDINELKEQISNKEAALIVVFPENFEQLVMDYDSSSNTPAPSVEIYRNSADTSISAAYSALVSMLDQYESGMINKFDIISEDLATERDSSAMVFSSMLPMLLMIFLFTGCMSVAPESIAGEKERGTIATLLITPVKRSEIALGKICALSLIALLSGLSSTLGTLLSLPKLMGGASEGMNANIYTVTDYAMLGIVILSTVLFLVALISIVSAFAKTLKEAQAYVTPLMILSMLTGITAMFGGGAQTEFFYYLIPLYNSVQCMTGILAFDISITNVIIAIISNLVYTVISVFVLTRMFNSERIIFNR